MLKLWLFSGLLITVAVPLGSENAVLAGFVHAALVLGVGIVVGLVESSMARLPLVRVPQALLAIALLALLSILLAPSGGMVR